MAREILGFEARPTPLGVWPSTPTPPAPVVATPTEPRRGAPVPTGPVPSNVAVIRDVVLSDEE